MELKRFLIFTWSKGNALNMAVGWQAFFGTYDTKDEAVIAFHNDGQYEYCHIVDIQAGTIEYLDQNGSTMNHTYLEL